MFNAIVSWIRRKAQERRDAVMFERQVIVTFDDERVTVAPPRIEPQSIAWHDIERVVIETNDSGPWGADAWWILEGAGLRVAYPNGATGEEEMLGQFPRRLAGFRDSALIDGMNSTSNAHFVCWERGGTSHTERQSSG